MPKPKVTVVGAGFVGATTAQRIVEKELADVVLVDIIEGLPQGKALDMAESAPIEQFDAKIVGSNTYDETAGSHLVVITAGVPRKPGMSRSDLLDINAKILGKVLDEVVKRSPNSMLLVVSNPLDAMVYLSLKKSGFPPNRVFGMAGVLDTARMRAFIAMEAGVSAKDVEAMVLGGHGDTMVPLTRFSTVSGVPASQLLSKEKLDRIVERTRNGGAEIVQLLKTGSAFYAPSSAVVAMVKSILLDEKRILPTACYLQGEYGLKDVYVGVPAQLGARGVEKVVVLELDADEKKALENSAAHVRELIEDLRKLGYVA